jgi:hypothetical protein
MKICQALFYFRPRNGSYRSVIRLMFVTIIQTSFILSVVTAWAQTGSSVPKGEEVVSVIEGFAREQALAAAQITAIGALSNAVLGSSIGRPRITSRSR